MAADTRARPSRYSLDSDTSIYEDGAHNYLEPQFTTSSIASDNNAPVLGGLPLGNIQNIGKPSLDTITAGISNLYISTISKENIHDQQTGKVWGRTARPRIEENTFKGPVITASEEHDICEKQNLSHISEETSSSAGATVAAPTPEDFQTYNPIAVESRQLPSNQEQLSKHQAGQFEWVLSIPVSNSAIGSRSFSSSHEDPEKTVGPKKLYFGCNFVHPTQIDGDEQSGINKSTTVEETTATEETEGMSVTQVVDLDTTIIRMSEAAMSVKNDDIVEVVSLPPVNPTPPRIEDSVEALDKLEEELEALTEVAGLDRVFSPADVRTPARTIDIVAAKTAPLQRTNSTTRRPGTSTARARTVERASSVRKSTSMTFTNEEEKPAAKAGPRKSTVARPTSLLPPKAPVKSSKPTTVPAFELPGEAVARRLKEAREARRSQHITPEQAAAAAAAYSPSKPHVKSTKPPTRPTFELPGEAISRRKREEREAKLRAQEEEERRRREFKARPIRASIVPSLFVPRETLASKARRAKGSQEEATESATAVAKKRQSIAVGSISRSSVSTTPHLSATLPSRGRTSIAGSNGAHFSRGTSTTSTGSIHGGSSVGKRSTISAEEAQQQRLRGREIFARDNSYVVDRERERRDREAAIKLARQEAAEWSRQLSREFAEKQRLKKEAARSA
ncbi:hypothetical protein B0H66DRAFT_605903 [Apodospora peruviana]|uniref:Uncharacterized protein n=1 Tax=Apodospora peruviana TaxID=516989 RepID=A0AAE0HY35_9PEZI|nr:hypothetical protein B0H66DRAFT_605903 [Apodospora peruviana]